MSQCKLQSVSDMNKQALIEKYAEDKFRDDYYCGSLQLDEMSVRDLFYFASLIPNGYNYDILSLRNIAESCLDGTFKL